MGNPITGSGSDNLMLMCVLHLAALCLGIITLMLVKKPAKPTIALLTVLLSAIFTSVPTIPALVGSPEGLLLNGGLIIGEISVRIDALSAWFILIINLISVTGVLYGAGYLKQSEAHGNTTTLHWIMYVIFHASMLWVCMVSNGLVFVIVWEIMSLSSLMLIVYEHHNQNVLKAGISYLVQMHLSVVLLTIAFIWVYYKTNTFDFSGMGTFFAGGQNLWLFLLFFAGFGLKAGFLGLHTWLPQAHPAAPSHISGVMSGVIVKMGIYGLFRVISYMQADFVLAGEIVLTIAILTGIFGILNAAVHRDFKKMLAYCTIENIGIIGMGIGLGLIGLGKGNPTVVFLGFGGALLHVLNHSVFKSLIFFAAGSVYRQTHTRNMDHLGGLLRQMPVTGMLFLLAAIAIGGLPPFSGFVSEFMIFFGLLSGIGRTDIALNTLLIGSFAGLSIIGGISVLAFTKSFGTIFLGSPRTQLSHQPVEVSRQMLIPQFILLAAMLILVLLPGFITGILAQITGIVAQKPLNNAVLQHLPFTLVLQKIAVYSLLFVVVAGMVYYLRYFMTRNAVATAEPTWGCGYTAPHNGIQYTGKSFSKSLAKLFSFIITEKKRFKEITQAEIFPRKRSYASSYQDVIEDRLINPLLIYLRRFINLFQFVQNGRIQAYVLYGILFILIIFIGTILNFFE